MPIYGNYWTSLRHFRSQNNWFLCLKVNPWISGYYQPVNDSYTIYLHLLSLHMIFKHKGWMARLAGAAGCKVARRPDLEMSISQLHYNAPTRFSVAFCVQFMCPLLPAASSGERNLHFWRLVTSWMFCSVLCHDLGFKPLPWRWRLWNLGTFSIHFSLSHSCCPLWFDKAEIDWSTVWYGLHCNCKTIA